MPEINSCSIPQKQPFPIEASIVSKRTINPIRQIVDSLRPTSTTISTTTTTTTTTTNHHQGPKKSFISLALGDPSESSLFEKPPGLSDAVKANLDSGSWNGYPPATGYRMAREAIARSYSCETTPVTADDVVIACGCSGALEMSISAIANEGDVVLIPNPGFPLYATICQSKAITATSYPLLPHSDWEIDLSALEAIILDQHSSRRKIAALLVNNPSNPCGSVFTKSHLLAILDLAQKYSIPIIADEIYRGIVFDAQTRPFIPLYSLSKSVPILTCGGLAKQYLVPGWRVGWTVVHDINGQLTQIRDALSRLACLILGANSLAQSVIPFLLEHIPASYYENMNANLKKNAELCRSKLSTIKGLVPVVPQGAMYMMVGIDITLFKKHDNDGVGGDDNSNTILDDVSFSQLLVKEENVLCLPGRCFSCPNFIRLVITSPPSVIEDALDRIKNFCDRHANRITK